MATITITVPDAVVNRVMDALSARFGYNPAVDGTKAAFVKKTIGKWVKSQVSAHEADQAGAVASTAAAASVEAEIVIT